MRELLIVLGIYSTAIVVGHAPAIIREEASPAYCYTTGEWLPFPEILGYCPDGQAPFNNVGPSYGGGAHRWPDGTDD